MTPLAICGRVIQGIGNPVLPIDLLSEGLQGRAARPKRCIGLFQPVIRKEIALSDLAEPGGQLLKVAFDFLKLCKREFLKLRFLVDFSKKAACALGEFIILAGAIRPEPGQDGILFGLVEGRDREKCGAAALLAHRHRKLRKQLRVVLGRRKNPGPIMHTGSASGAKASPQRHTRTGRRSGKLRQQ